MFAGPEIAYEMIVRQSNVIMCNGMGVFAGGGGGKQPESLGPLLPAAQL